MSASLSLMSAARRWRLNRSRVHVIGIHQRLNVRMYIRGKKTLSHEWSGDVVSSPHQRVWTVIYHALQAASINLLLVYKSLHHLAPPYLSDDCQLVTDVGRRHLRSADVHTCTVPRTQSRLGDRSFGVAGPRLWNNLPVALNCDSKTFASPSLGGYWQFCFAETRRIVTSLF